MVADSKETINSFNGGLNVDIDDSLIPKNQYRDALNMRVVASRDSSASTLQPYTGFNSKKPYVEVGDYTIISTISVRNYIVTFKVTMDENSQVFMIDKYDTTSNTNTPILNTNTPIIHNYTANSKFSCVSRFEDFDNIKVYWADGVNPIRSINVSDFAQPYNDTITNADQFNIKPLIDISKPRFKDFGTGSLLSGKIQYAYFLYNKNGQQTEMSIPSELISLTTVSDTDGSYFNIKGDKLNENIGKSCIMEFDTPAGDYQRMKVISIHYADNSSTPKIRLVGDIKLENTNTTTFIDFGTTVLAEYTVDEFNLISGINFSAKYIESKNNYLFAGNITNIDWDIEYDARAYRANLAGYTVLMSSINDTIAFPLQHLDGSFNNESGASVYLTHDCINPYNDLNKEYTYYNNTRFLVNYYPNGSYYTVSVNGGTPLYDYDDKYAYIREIDENTNNIKSIKFGGIGPNIKYEFIWTEIELDEATDPTGGWTDINQISRSASIKTKDNNIAILSKKSFEGLWHYDQDDCAIHSKDIDGGVELKDRFCNYSNSYINLKYQSLHRDELYRYGIQFYNKYGVKSTVKWIGDIRTPHKLDYKHLDIYGSNDTKNSVLPLPFGNNELISFKSDGTLIETGLKARPLGIRFTIGNVSSLISDGVVGYEIVRVKRTIKDKSILSQGYISQLYFPGGDSLICNKIYPSITHESVSYNNKLYPSYGYNHTHKGYQYVDGVIQFVSPDTTYSSESFYNYINNLNIYSSIIGIYGSILTLTSNTVMHNNILDYGYGNTSVSAYYAPNSNYWGCNEPIQYSNLTGSYITDGVHPLLGSSYSDSASEKTHLNISLYYTDLHYSDDLLAIGKNTKFIKDLNISKNYQWNQRIGMNTSINTNYTDIFGLSVYNYNYDSHLPFSTDPDAGEAAQGPSSPSLYISEDLTDPYRLSLKSLKTYFDDISNINKFKTVRQSSLNSRNQGINSKDIGKTVYNLYSNYNIGSVETTDFYGHSPFYDMVIINLKHQVNPYNGNTYQSRQYSTYTSIGCLNKIDDLKIKPKYYKENTSVIDTFNGDTFLCIFDNQRNHTIYQETDHGVREQQQRKSVNFMIPLETSINLTLTNGEEIHRNASPEIQIDPASIPVIADLVPNGYTQTEPLYQYNSAYSAISDVVIDTVRNELDELDKKLDTRIVHSEQKINDEIQDSWTIFKANNFLELDNRYGSLTNLKLFKNQLLAFQENALSQLAVKERTILQDNNISGLVLGTGDILERYDYITTNYGIAPDQSKVIIDTESALYWFDHYRNQILSYNGQLELLSKKKYIQSYLNTNTIKDYPIAVYNRELNDVMFNLFTDTIRPTIAFNEQIDGFSSFYSIDYISGNNVNGKLYLFKDSTVTDPSYSIIEYADTKVVDNKTVNNINEFLDGKKHDSSITYVVNEGYDQTKIFDNVEFNGLYPFTHTEIQYEVDGKKTYTIDSSDIQNRELTYKYAIPRVVSGEDIPDRVRGNATTCTFKITPDGKLFRIPYFKTKFRTSKS